MDFQSSAALIGSLPHEDHGAALELVLAHITEVPGWVQLPKNPAEGMVEQFARGLPGLAGRRWSSYIDTSDPGFEEELLGFFEDYLAVTEGGLDVASSRFALSPPEDAGFSLFQKKCSGRGRVALKGQITGPFTIAASLTDENKRLALYNDQLKDAIVKHLELGGRFQVERLNAISENVLIFMDEPALAGFGTSAFISVSREEVAGMLGEVARGIRAAGGLAGIHVCANTDWSLVLDLPLDVVNFDAYSYLDRFALYRNEVLAFLEGGGSIAWGIVPTMNEADILAETPESLAERLVSQAEELFKGELSLKEVFARSLITPSCGCGSLTVELAEKVVRETAQVSRLVRERFGL